MGPSSVRLLTGFALGSCTFLLSGLGSVVGKPGFRFGSFLLGSVSFPSLEISTVLGSRCALLKLDVIFAEALNHCLFKKNVMTVDLRITVSAICCINKICVGNGCHDMRLLVLPMDDLCVADSDYLSAQ